MSQPVKLSDALVLDARMTGDAQQRSIAGQVEFWARLGRGLELLLDGRKVLELSRAAGSISLSALLDVVDTPKGREMFKAYLESEPFPHYEAHPKNPDLLIRIDKNGTRTAGRFVNRVFVSEPVTGVEKPSTGLSQPKMLKGIHQAGLKQSESIRRKAKGTVTVQPVRPPSELKHYGAAKIAKPPAKRSERGSRVH